MNNRLRGRRASLLGILSLVGGLVVGSASPAAASGPNIVSEWNLIAENTVVPSGAAQIEALIYLSYTQLAVYDAVVAIKGGYEPYGNAIQAPAGASVKAKFSDSNDQMIDAYVMVRPDVIQALGLLVRGGSSLDSRANACRALGILRGGAALPELVDALRSKENNIMYESLAAIEKIRDPSAGPKITFLLRDLDDRVQMTAIETAGVLRSTDALPTLRNIVASPRNTKAERSAMASIAMMPEAQDRDLFLRYLNSKDEKLRASSAEGIGRIGNRADEPAIEKAWHDEEKMSPRLAAAFAVVMEGRLDLGEDGAFRYLINNLNSAAWHETAYAYLAEAALRKPVLEALYTQLDSGTRDEKIYLSRVLSVSGDAASVPYLEKTSRDNDAEVAKEGLRALRSLRARLGI